MERGRFALSQPSFYKNLELEQSEAEGAHPKIQHQSREETAAVRAGHKTSQDSNHPYGVDMELEQSKRNTVHPLNIEPLFRVN